MLYLCQTQAKFSPNGNSHPGSVELTLNLTLEPHLASAVPRIGIYLLKARILRTIIIFIYKLARNIKIFEII